MCKKKRAHKTSSIGEILDVIVVQLNFLQPAIPVATSAVRFHLSLPYANAAVVNPYAIESSCISSSGKRGIRDNSASLKSVKKAGLTMPHLQRQEGMHQNMPSQSTTLIHAYS